MKTANATRPKFGEPWHIDAMRWEGAKWSTCTISRSGSIDTTVASDVIIANAARAVACVNALAGIANPSAIPALIEAARHIAERGYHGVGSDESVALLDALAELDDEPVADLNAHVGSVAKRAGL